MVKQRFQRQTWRLRINLWFARLRGRWQVFADHWRVPPVITNRWVVLGAYFLVVLLVGLAWFGHPNLDWQGAKPPEGASRGIYEIGFFGNPADDLSPAPNQPSPLQPQGAAAEADYIPADPDNPAVPVDSPENGVVDEPDAPANAGTTVPSDQQQSPVPPPAPSQPQSETMLGGGSLPFSQLTYPVEGEVAIANPYALVSHSATLNDWRAHLAVDLVATAGSPVRAAAAGTIKQVLQNDMLWGTVVIISHGNGCTTSYSSLQDLTVRVGQAVTAGQVLGKLAGSPPAEQLELSHLHFELFDGQAAVDPTDLFR